MVAQQQNRPQFNSVRELVNYLNDHQVGAPVLNPASGMYEQPVINTPIDLTRRDLSSIDQVFQINDYMNMVLTAIDGNLRASNQKAEIDAVLASRTNSPDYQFMRRLIDNFGSRS